MPAAMCAVLWSAALPAALVAAMEHIPKKWANVQAVFLRTSDSVALPVFQALPESGTKVAV